MRELYRLNKNDLSVKYDMWALIKKKFTKEDSSEVEKVFKELLAEIKKR